MKTAAIILSVLCLLLAGCEPERQQNQNPQAPEESEQPSKEQTAAETPAPEAEQQNADKQQEFLQQADGIKVDVTVLIVDEKDFNALDALWGYSAGAYTMKKRSDLFDESGLKVNMTAKDFSSRFDAFESSIKPGQKKEFSIALAERETGFLNLGEGIKNPRFYYLAKWYDAKEYRFSDAVRGFDVKVTKVPGRELFNVQITPVLKNFLSDGADKEFGELKVSLTIAPSQLILIGGTRTSREYLASVLFGLQEKNVDAMVLLNFSEM